MVVENGKTKMNYGALFWVQNFLSVQKYYHNVNFFFFSPNSFLPCKDTFMDDYDGIYNFNSLKYNNSKNFDNFWFIIFYGDKNIK